MLQTLLLTLLAAYQSHATEFYTAAVVEYATPYTPLLTADEVMVANAAVYALYMANASLSKVDIIVFPEGGLIGHKNSRKAVELPSPAEQANPCINSSDYHQALVMLSCAARKFRMYAVVNVGEQYYNITTNKTEYYNSNVAFDRNGTVVGRYRKYNPYGEPVTKPPVDHHYFETDFGVQFGMFICFDIDFMEPGVVLARDYGIKHFAFPHCWISELPFLTAIQAQWGWAYSLDSVLLASGCNDPQNGGTGSGIYHGRRGALKYFQTNDHTSRLLIAQVPTSFEPEGRSLSETPKDALAISYSEPSSGITFEDITQIEVHLLNEGQPQSNSSLFLLRDYTDVYKSRLLMPPRDSQYYTAGDMGANTSLAVTLTTKTSLCQGELCCDFQVQMTSSFNATPPAGPVRGDDFTRQFYRLVAFDGVRWYGGGIATGGVQICGVVSCVNESISSCGLRADDPTAQVAAYGPLYKVGTVFEEISITASFIYNKTFIYPDILTTGVGDDFGALVPSQMFTYETYGPFNGSLIASLKIENPISNLISAAIYARQFDRDGQKRTELPTPNHANLHTSNIIGICILFLCFFNWIFSAIK